VTTNVTVRQSCLYNVTGDYISRLRRSILARIAHSRLVPNFPTELATHLQQRVDSARSGSPRDQVALANPLYHPEGITMPRVKFSPDALKTVGMHKEQRNRQIYRYTDVRLFFADRGPAYSGPQR